MTAAAPLAFPTAKILGDWWRQLAAREPLAVWVGRLRVHRVEALAFVEQTRSLDSVTLHFLRALTVSKPAGGAHEAWAPSASASTPATLKDVEALLGFHSFFVHRLLTVAERDGLVFSGRQGGIVPLNRAAENETWTVTPVGWQSLRSGSFSRQFFERRIFHFVERLEAGRFPHFIKLTSPELDFSGSRHGRIVPEGSNFDTHALKACIAQPPAWKQRWGFPLDILEILGPSQGRAVQTAGGTEPTPWQRVVVDSPGELFVLALREPQHLRGFAVRPEGWIMQAADPCFTLEDSDWREAFPHLVDDPPTEAWRRAWLIWGKSCNLPSAEMEAAQLERMDIRLRIKAGKKLIDRLRSSRRDALKGESWIIAGEGLIRGVAQLEFCES